MRHILAYIHTIGCVIIVHIWYYSLLAQDFIGHVNS